MAKKLEEYEKHPNYVFPELAWIFDRGVPIFVVFFLGALFIAGMIKGGFEAFERMSQPREITPEYLDISSSDPIGLQWGQNFITITPPNTDAWSINDDRNLAHVISRDSCKNIDSLSFPSTIMGTFKAHSDSIKETLQVFGAGQAAAYFEEYKKTLHSCILEEKTLEEYPEVKALILSNSFTLISGDAILGVEISDQSLSKDDLISFYAEKLEETLKEVQCISLVNDPEYQYRNIFYHPDDFTGFLMKENVMPTFNVDNVSTPTGYVISQIKNPELETPDGPLPEDFPLIAETVSSPVLPSNFSLDYPSETVSYQVEDNDGPGCGWNWSAQKEPTVDREELENNKSTILADAQVRVNTKAEEYVNQKTLWSGQIFLLAPEIYRWNEYVKEVNSIHDQWIIFNSKREAFKPIWDYYVTSHNAWLTFEEDKIQAQIDYDNEIKVCNDAAAELDEWKKKYENNSTSTTITSPSPSPSPSVPPRPAGCTNYPERPEILDQERPFEPQEPLIPVDITVPDSWERPIIEEKV